MAKARTKDIYPQFMVPSVTQSAADTLTFGRVNVGISLFDYAGFILSRIEYHISGTNYNLVNAAEDGFTVAITGSNTLASLPPEDSRVYDLIGISAAELGSPTDQYVGGFQIQPIVHDFSSMEGGGLLVPAQDIYIACDSSSITSALSVVARIYYRVISLDANDYIELAQRLRVLSSD